MALVVRDPPASAGDIQDAGSILGSGRTAGQGHGSPLQYSCLKNSMDRGAWWAMVHGVAKSGTRLKQLNTHTHTTTVQAYRNGVQQPLRIWTQTEAMEKS